MAKIPELDTPQDTGALGWLRSWLDTLRTWTRTRDPAQTTVGDPLDKFTDRRELVSLGILRRSSDGTFRAGDGFGSGATIIMPGGGGTGGGGGTPDYTPPPTPTGLAVTAGISTLIVEWDAPTYTQGHGNAWTRIYGAIWLDGDAEPTFSDPRTKLIDQAAEQAAVRAYATQPDTRWCIWIAFVTRDGVQSPTPAGGAHGVQARTGQDVTALLRILRGQITEGQLYQSLVAPIRSIVDRADDAAEDALRAALAAHQSAQRSKEGLLQEAAARGTAITETRTLVNTGDAQLASLITTLTAKVSDNRTEALAAVQDEADARADAVGSEATQRSTLATQMRGSYTGTDLSAVTEGLIFSERQARSGVDTAHAGRLDALESTVNNPSTGVSATATALDAVETEVFTGANRNSALASRASALEATVNDSGTGLGATRASLSTTQSTLATLDGRASTTYAVRTTVSAGGRTVAGGFGLMGNSTATPGSEIEFGIIANRFWIGAPSGSGVADTQLFTFQTTTWSDNGITRPAGAFIDAAFIKNLTAIYATIQTAVIDDIHAASISVGKLTAGSIATGEYIQSSGFTSGSGATPGTGFRITGSGNAEFNNAIFRGTIYATAGRIGGNDLGADYIQSSGFVAGVTGWQIKSDGTAEFGSTAIRGTLTTDQLAPRAAGNMPSSRVFPGVVSASGTFSELDSGVVPVACNAVHIVHLIGVMPVASWPATATVCILNFYGEFNTGASWGTQNTGHCSIKLRKDEVSGVAPTGGFMAQYQLTTSNTQNKFRVKFAGATFYDASGAPVGTTSADVGECNSIVFAQYK